MAAASLATGSSAIRTFPTEECFTTPHKDRVDGVVRASKPLSHQGTLIENITCTFEGGKIISATATAGEDVLNRLDFDRRRSTQAIGARWRWSRTHRPIAQSGILFWNTLFDENAASHIALGQAYATCLVGGDKMTAGRTNRVGSKFQSHPRRLDDRIGRDECRWRLCGLMGLPSR